MMKFLAMVGITGLATIATASTLPVQDGDFSCVSRQKAEAYVRDFNINVQSFGGFELCNGEVDTKKLFNDLQLVEEGRFGSGPTNIFIRNIIPVQSYFPWLKEQTAGIRRGHDMPTATAYNSMGYFTMQDGWAKLSTLGRVGTLIHEARHTEGYYHVQCRQGPYRDASSAGCDSGLNQQGSHGVEMEYYSRVVLQGQNFHPVYARMARLMNLGRANFVFNQSPMVKSEVLAGITGQAIVVLDQAGEHREHIINAPSNDLILKKASHGLTLYKGDSAYAFDLSGESAEAVADEFSYFKLLLDGRLSDVADAEEVDIGTRRYFVVLTKQGRLHTYQFAAGRWSQGVDARDVVALATTAPNGREGLFTVNAQGEVRPLDPDSLRRGQRLFETWPDNVADFVVWNQQLLAVGTDGVVLDTGSGKTFYPLANWRIQQLVRVPLFNAF